MLPPHSREADSGTQLEQFGSLDLSNMHSASEMRFSRDWIGAPQFTHAPVQFRFGPDFRGSRADCERLIQLGLGEISMPHPGMDVGPHSRV